MMKRTKLWMLRSITLAAALLSGCGGSTSTTPPHASTWTWVNGANTMGQKGVYGTQGTASPSNVPGARHLAVSWTDRSGKLWLFGGDGRDSIGSFGHLNDLWKFDRSNWVWISGANSANQVGVYGTRRTASPSNVPGARNLSTSAADHNGNLWLFGGGGRDSAGTGGGLNDLWKFDGINWTWVSGANTVNQASVYGIRGTADQLNVPGARISAILWIDGSGNLWLFGGTGYDSTGNLSILIDLWKFNGTDWTWISGAAVGDQPGVYGTQGMASPSNVPGARGRLSWMDRYERESLVVWRKRPRLHRDRG